jgi:hypothetical protein
MRKDDALVELADIKKDLPHWPDEVIKPWLRRVSLAKKTSTGVEPGCGGRGGPDDRHFPKRLANLNIFRAFGRTSAPPAQRFAGVRQSGSIAPPLRPSAIPLSTTVPQRGTTMATIRKRRDKVRGPGRRAASGRLERDAEPAWHDRMATYKRYAEAASAIDKVWRRQGHQRQKSAARTACRC